MPRVTLSLLAALVATVAMSWVPQPSAAVNPGKIVLTETVIVGEVEDMLWVGSAKQIVLILTDVGKVYRSANEGMTWVDQTPLLAEAVKSGYVAIVGPVRARVACQRGWCFAAG
jgi:hypothetical protein